METHALAEPLEGGTVDPLPIKVPAANCRALPRFFGTTPPVPRKPATLDTPSFTYQIRGSKISSPPSAKLKALFPTGTRLLTTAVHSEMSGGRS